MPTVEYLNYEVLAEHGWSIEDDNLFYHASETDFDEEDHGWIDMGWEEYILDAAKRDSLEWPLECEDGTCVNCAAVIYAGEIEMELQQMLSDEEVKEKDVRLTCIGKPVTEHVKIIYNAKNLDYLHDRIV